MVNRASQLTIYCIEMYILNWNKIGYEMVIRKEINETFLILSQFSFRLDVVNDGRRYNVDNDVV